MAQDDGTGRPVYPTLPTPAAKPDVGVESGELTKFKNEVDELLVRLDESEAAERRVAGERMVQSHLGTPALRESAFLYGTYMVVHDQLEELSRMLALQIEGLSVGLQASRNGYDGMNEDIRSRMQLLAKEAGTEYGDGDRAQQSGAPQGTGGAGGQARPGSQDGQI
ncbi:hypothetical protein ACFXKG_08660 [Streptomyces sp. NPDC059255]|uniref:hypothetical protein n=1 Tax=Streptomyces sp. NPDC059255 TaxID=3346793 RepID=UPI0036B9A6C9